MKKQADFKRVFADGRRRAGRYFTVFVLPTGNDGRIGIVVSRRFGNAVVRNRIKRQVREAFRNNRALFYGYDIVVVPREECRGKETDEITRALVSEVAVIIGEVRMDGEESDIPD